MGKLQVNGDISSTGTIAASSFLGNASSASKLQTARSIFGRNFDGSENILGHAYFYGSYNSVAGNRYGTGGIEIRENDLVLNTQSDLAYAPAIGFHWGSVAAGSICYNGIFYFKTQAWGRASIDANLIGTADWASGASYASTLYNSSNGHLSWSGDHMISSNDRPSAKLHFGATQLYQHRDGNYYILLDSGNFSSYALPSTGGTLTGGLRFTGSNGIWVRHINGENQSYGGDLYLNYAENAPVHFGTSGSYTISADGSYYSGNCNYANSAGYASSANSANSASSASWASGATYANSIGSTGFGDGNFTYLQTSGDFYGATGWAHYLIANHGNGATYYNYVIKLPFWGVPQYKYQTGNTSAVNGWYDFITSENYTSYCIPANAYISTTTNVDGDAILKIHGRADLGCLLLTNEGWTGYGTANPNDAGLSQVVGRVYFQI